METVGFIGSYDKTDLIIYVAKVLTTVGKKVLVIDHTITQKAKYIVPVINPTKSYVTEFEGIDVSVGFSNYEEIKKFLGIPEEKLRLFEKYAKKDINFHYNASQTLSEQNVSEKAKILIAILFRDYWANDEQRQKILASEKTYKTKIEEEKRNKYNPDNIFIQTNQKSKIDTNVTQNNVSMIEYKEAIIKKIINKLKNIFHKN